MLRVAAAQVEPVPLDVAANVAIAADLVRRADADLVVFPELSLIGYDLPAIANSGAELRVGPDDRRLEPLLTACQAARAVAIVGAPVPSPRGLLLAALVVTPDGRAPGIYAKRLIDSDEQRVFVAGEEPGVIDVAGRRVGLGLCVEAVEPGHAAAARALGSEIYACGVIFPSSPADRLGETLSARARETGMWVVGAHVSGVSGSLRADGGSGVFAPDGQAVIRLGPEAPGLATAAIP